MVKRLRREDGFGFVELLVVIAVIGILAAVAMRSMTSTINDARRIETEREMEMLATAIVGNPSLTADFHRTDFGYVGDIGSFPSSLTALYSNPGYSTWDGPYIPSGFAQDTVSYRLDEWGAAYSYSGGLTISSTGGGSSITKKIADATSDYLSNQFLGIVADDNDSLPGTIKKDSVRVRVTIPNGAGGISSKNYTPNGSGEFTLDSIPVGTHQLHVIYLPQNDTLERYVTVLPRHVNSSPPVFKFTAGYFSAGGGGSCSGSVILRPDGVGNFDDLIPSSGAGWQCVDEATADDNTSYVERPDNSWADDVYRLPDPASQSCAPISVTVYIRCKREHTQGDCRAVIRTGGNIYTGTTNALTTTWTDYSHSWNTNPATGVAWTWSDINNLQAGIDLRGQNSNFSAFCTQVWVVVTY